jgi:hypothetical protein
VVSERQTTTPATEEQQIQQLAETLELEDSTPPEVGEAADAAAAAERAGESAARGSEGAEAGSVATGVAEGEAPAPVETTEVPAAKPAGVDLSQSPEWRQAQSAYDTRIAALEQQAAAIGQQQQAAVEQQQVVVEQQQVAAYTEAELARQEQAYAVQMGEEAAREAVRSPANTGQVRRHFETQAELVKTRAALQTGDQMLDHAGKIVAVGQYAAHFGVTDADKSLLFGTQSPAEMVQLAQRLGKQNVTQSRVPAETPETSLQAQESAAMSGADDASLLTSLQDKDWSEMSAGERRVAERAFRG